MEAAVIGKALAVWLVILGLAIANGALRESVLSLLLGKAAGLFVSGVLLSAVSLAVACLALPWFGQLPARSYIAIGLIWVGLTLIFEFTFGHFIQRKSWQEILQAYRFSGGNIWPLVLVVVGTSPVVAALLKGWF